MHLVAFELFACSFILLLSKHCEVTFRPTCICNLQILRQSTKCLSLNIEIRLCISLPPFPSLSHSLSAFSLSSSPFSFSLLLHNFLLQSGFLVKASANIDLVHSENRMKVGSYLYSLIIFKPSIKKIPIALEPSVEDGRPSLICYVSFPMTVDMLLVFRTFHQIRPKRFLQFTWKIQPRRRTLNWWNSMILERKLSLHSISLK